MVNIMEANGQLFEGKTVICSGCGQEHESYDPHTPEGGYEYCDDCVESDREDEARERADR